jgi:glutamyl-tRNA synthetase
MPSSPVRTRFAPSPTGYLHIGGARTALFAWAYARRHGGQFILRIEDTDLERSTAQATQAILDGLAWLGLAADEGPYFQTHRMDRYRALIRQLLDAGLAYPCYMSKTELDTLRAQQEACGDKPRYDGRWRPEPGKSLPPPPPGVSPVIRFRNPQAGQVSWDDLVKGEITFSNTELDDFIIARADGSPTYNFCVVADDLDMGITHVIRGDDHVNNTPRQINVLNALGAPVPRYAHLSMILGDDGQKLSKRRNAVAVTDYDAQGYLPEAVLNYLARLGWSHGDDEIFSLAQFVSWFDLDHITPSCAQFNTEKLKWINAHYIKQSDDHRLLELVRGRLPCPNPAQLPHTELERIVGLYKDRASTLNELAFLITPLLSPPRIAQALRNEHLTPAAIGALTDLCERLRTLQTWERPALAAAIKSVCVAQGLKMPQVAIPLRVALLGQTQSPAIDALLDVLGREESIARLALLTGQDQKQTGSSSPGLSTGEHGV